MPLTKSASRLAFKNNVKKEVESGRPVKQAVAIAYSEKRAAAKKGVVKKTTGRMRRGQQMTVRDLIRMSFLNIGVLAEGEDPTAAQLQDAIMTLNFLLDTWSTEKLFICSITQEVFNFVGGQQTYLMGAGAPDFNTARPIFIETASVRINPGAVNQLDIPMAIFGPDEWARISVKLTQAVWPTRMYADFQFPYVNLNFYPVPNETNELYITSWKPLTSLSTANTEFSMAPGFAEAVLYNLAIRLCPMYGRPASPEILALAQAAKSKLKISLSKMYLMRADQALLPPDGKIFNYLTGE